MRVGLVGNQNSGKSTLFNTMTGLNQKIGNWPGVTIEKKVGKIKNTEIELIDLPGIYSLNAYTKEEEITCQFLLQEKMDAIINIIDCNSISRGLYLTMQLLESNLNVILLLNMYDIAEKKGIKIDEKKLAEELGDIPVIKISAITGEGIDKVIRELNIQRTTNSKSKKTMQINSKQINSKQINQKQINQKQINLGTNPITEKLSITKNDLEKFNSEKMIKEVYHKIDFILEKVINRTNTVAYKQTQTMSLTDKLDRIFLNKILAIPIFIFIMFVIYYVSIEIVGNQTVDAISICFENISNHLEEFLMKNGAVASLTSLIIDGMLSGVSAVISFLPQLAFLFIMISFLEKIGYMSRISLIWDKLFKKLGMSGNSVISFILGTGCSVPGIMATKTIKNEKEKKVTSMLTPFIPCSAKLPIISLFSNYFFQEKSGLTALSFYILAIFIIIISSLFLKKIERNNHEAHYLSELPEYRLPKFRQILKDSWERIWDFIKRAGSIILLSSIIVWLLLSYSFELEYGVDVQESILADIGRTFSWIFIPMIGENSWEVAVSSIQGLVAKEQVISSMAIIAGLENETASSHMFAPGSPYTFFTPAAAYAYVCFNLFSAPCIAAISAMKKTLGNQNMLKAISYQIGVAYVISCLVYQIGNLF